MKNRFYFIFLIVLISIGCKTTSDPIVSDPIMPRFDLGAAFHESFERLEGLQTKRSLKHITGVNSNGVFLNGNNYIRIPFQANRQFPYGTSIWFKGIGKLISNEVKCTYNRSWGIDIEKNRLYFLCENKKTLKVDFHSMLHYLSTDEWNHLFINFVSDSLVQFYCNGVLLNELELTSSLNKPNAHLFVGSSACGKTQNNFNGAFSGSVDELSIFAKSLTPFEIKKIFYSNRVADSKMLKNYSSTNDIEFYSLDGGLLEWELKSINKPVSHFKIYRNESILDSVSFNSNQSKYKFIDLVGVGKNSYKLEVIGLDNNVVYTSVEQFTDRKIKRAKHIYPGIEGFGIEEDDRGKRKTYNVTNLDNSGPGSLRYGLENISNPRSIVFDVSGVIKLKSHINLSDPYVSVFGQTAPEGGIHLIGGGLIINTHDVLIQHLTIRPSDNKSLNISPVDHDAIAILGKEGGSKKSKHTYNIVIDHCSLSWAMDENISIWYNGVSDVTISNCIISEGLNKSRHPKGKHSKGLLVGPNSKNIAIVKNIFYNNVDRNPFISGNCDVLIVNNLIYGCKTPIHIEDVGGQGHINAILKHNLVSHSNKTKKKFSTSQIKTNLNKKNNILLLDKEVPVSMIKTVEPKKFNKAFTSFRLNNIYSTENLLLDYLMNNAGANPRKRMATDQRIIQNIKDGIIPEPLNCVACIDKGSSIFKKEIGSIPHNKRSFTLPQNFKGDLSTFIHKQSSLSTEK